MSERASWHEDVCDSFYVNLKIAEVYETPSAG